MAPVLVGTAVGVRYGELIWWRAVLCLVLAVALQIGVNYANDYSDGVRGVDTRPQGAVAADGVGPGRARLGEAGGDRLLRGRRRWPGWSWP